MRRPTGQRVVNDGCWTLYLSPITGSGLGNQPPINHWLELLRNDVHKCSKELPHLFVAIKSANIVSMWCRSGTTFLTINLNMETTGQLPHKRNAGYFRFLEPALTKPTLASQAFFCPDSCVQGGRRKNLSCVCVDRGGGKKGNVDQETLVSFETNIPLFERGLINETPQRDS